MSEIEVIEQAMTGGKQEKTASSKAVPKNISGRAAKKLGEIKAEVNSKRFGRSVKDSEIIELAINELKPKHIAMLRELTYSPTDRIRIRHEEYQAQNGEMSLDDFVRDLLYGKVRSAKSVDGIAEK